MSATPSAQTAHDALLELMPEGASHSCGLCETGAGTGQKAKEVAEVATDGERVFSETEHVALLTDAVARETAALQSDKQELETSFETLKTESAAQISDLQGRLDMLEAEKVAAEKARDEAQAEFEAFKTGLQELAEIEDRKAARSAAVKEAAGELLDDTYITDERIARWASMTEEAFESVLSDLRDLAAKAPKKAPKATDDDEDDQAEKARETAAFTGGESPTAETGGSLFGQYLTATGKLPAAQS